MNIGVDIVHISRIKRLYDLYGEHFLSHFMTEAEISKTLAQADVSRYVAKCWAIKEAAIKASDGTDAKQFSYSKAGKKPIIKTNVSGKWMLSLSDEKDTVVAMVVREDND